MTRVGVDTTMTGLAPVVDPGSVTIGVAVAVPEPCASRVRAARESYGDPQARAIPTHITLLPPAMVSSQAHPEIDAHLRAAASQVRPFTVTLSGTGTFRPVSPVVFLVVADGSVGCADLEGHIRTGPLLRRRNFPYHPHVTLVHEVGEDAMDAAQRDFAAYHFSFTVDRFTLYQQDGERIWRAVADYPLG